MIPKARKGALAWLVLTRGASPRRLSVAGPDRGGVLPARAGGAAGRRRAAWRGGGSGLRAGAGWMGLGAAAAARQYGCEVTVVEPERGALHRSLGPEVGEVFAALHRSHGVTLRFVDGLSAATGPKGKVTGAVTPSADDLPPHILLSSI